jgi:hypothetical protein
VFELLYIFYDFMERFLKVYKQNKPQTDIEAGADMGYGKFRCTTGQKLLTG